jgi:hypothetical protein
MAHVMPSIRVTDPHSKDAKPLERQDTGKLSTKGDGTSLCNLRAACGVLAQPRDADTQGHSTLPDRRQARVYATQPDEPAESDGSERSNTTAKRRRDIQRGEDAV